MDRRNWFGALSILGLSTLSRAGLADGKRPTRALPVPRAFRLEEDLEWGARQILIKRLAIEQSLRSYQLDEVLLHLNRRARSKGPVVKLFRDSEKKKKVAYQFKGAFEWDKHDAKTTAWYPQGITGSADAWPTGAIGARRVLLISWYARKNEHKGARITLVDVTSLNDIRYRHLLLVQPVDTQGKADFIPVPIHAGGIALYRNLLYVADTHSGVRVFDTHSIFKAARDRTKSKVGVVDGKAYAFDYRYAIPMVGHYRQPPGQNMRFSFVSLDRTAVPHSLWVGEYSAGTSEGISANFSLNPESARLASGAESALLSQSVLRFNRERTQGFVVAHGSYVLCHTYSNDPYRLHVQTQNGYAALEAPYGLEDLYYDPTLDRIWMQTEHPKSRAVFFNTAPDELK